MKLFGKQPSSSHGGDNCYNQHVEDENDDDDDDDDNNNNNNNKSDETLMNLDPQNLRPMPNLDSDEERVYAELQRISWVMDELFPFPFPGSERRFGLDPIIGIFPFVGDFGSAMMSLVLVSKAAPVSSRSTIVRMLFIVWIDAVVGTIPLVGDIFDMGWKANQRNVAIFEDHMKDPRGRRNVDQQFLWMKDRQGRRNVDRQFLSVMIFSFILLCFLTTLAMIALVVLLIMLLTGRL